MRVPTGAWLRRWAFRGLLLLSLVGAFAFYGLPLAYQLHGQRLEVLTSGSMAPKYPAGSVVVAQPITPDQLRVGQVITFKPVGEPTQVTHQIVALKPLPQTDENGDPVVENGRPVYNLFAQTKGFGNPEVDPNMTPVGNVRYLVVQGYPGLGEWLLWSRTLVGRVTVFMPPFLLLIAAELWSWRASSRPARRAARRTGKRKADVAPVTA
jgi:signal peptidase